MPVDTLVNRAITEASALEPAEAHAAAEHYLVVDVREPNEVLQGYIGHAINVPRGLLEFVASDDPRFHPLERPILLYSNQSRRAALAAQCLRELGFGQVAILRGGIEAWADAGLPVA